MDLSKFFQSVMEQDLCPVVICNLQHKIIYMNATAILRYQKRGGAELVGNSLLDCHGKHSQEQIKKVVSWFEESREHNRIYTFHNEKENKDVHMVALRDENGELIGYYEKHEYRDIEKGNLYDFGD